MSRSLLSAFCRTRSMTVSILSILAISVLISPPLVEAKKPAPICQPVVPCADSRGCPDMVIDPGVLAEISSHSIEFRTFASDDCVVLEGMVAPGTRKLLQFSTMTVNVGAGDLVLGNPLDHPDWFDLVTCHGHAHIKEYADYRLWSVAGYEQWAALRAADPQTCAQQVFGSHPELASQFVKGAKRGFCFFDVVPAGSPLLPSATVTCPGTLDPRKYTSCDFGGLSVCWADIYEPFIDGQWLDITDVPDGDYVLENEANARHFFTESDYTNNSASVRLNIHGKNVKVLR